MPAVTRRARIGFTVPAAVLLFAFVLAPFAIVIALSFTDLLLGERSASFAGLANYRALLEDYYFRQALLNSFMYVAMTVPGAVGLGLLCALGVTRTRWFGRFYRTVFFMPVMASAVAMLLVWEYLLHPDLGIVNAALGAIGLPRPGWLNDPATALESLALIGIWQLFGVNFLLFTVGLARIDRGLYEAGALDGIESAVDRFRYVTWPALLPTAGFVVLFTTIRSLQLLTAVQVLTRGGPEASTQVLLFHMYQEAFEFLDAGRGAATAVVFLMLIFVAHLLVSRLRRRPR